MKSLNAMVQQIEGMLGTNDLTPWEQKFVENIAERSDHGKNTGKLSDKQIERMEDIYRKHFGDG